MTALFNGWLNVYKQEVVKQQSTVKAYICVAYAEGITKQATLRVVIKLPPSFPVTPIVMELVDFEDMKTL